MDFEEFKLEIKMKMERRLGAGSVEIREAVKNNSVKRTGMILSRPGEEICPVIYLEGFYEKVCMGQAFEETAERIWELYLQHAEQEPFHAGEFLDWNRARKKISVRLLHYEKNRELLKDAPHRKFLDLAEVYYFTEETCGGCSAAFITDRHMEHWGICRRDLQEAAYANHKESGGTRIQNIDALIGSLLEGWIGSGQPQMYVATNSRNLGGAAAMLFPEEFSGLAKQLKRSLYILPSSIHELILLPADMGSPEELAGIVKDVNRTQVLPEEVLSDSVYRYDRQSGEIEIAWDGAERRQEAWSIS